MNRARALLAMALLGALAVPEPQPPPRRREDEPLDLDPFARASNRPIGNSTDSTIPDVVLVESRPARVSNLPDFYVRGPGWRAAEPPPRPLTEAELAAEAKRARKAEKLRAQATRGAIRGAR